MFAADPANKNKIVTSGVWSVTRHPNYFGEIFLWAGITISSATVYMSNDNWYFMAICSPAFTFLILMFLSGLPLGERRYNQKYGTQRWYLEYRHSTSPLIPMPACLYKSFNNTFRRLFCCEFDFYRSGLEDDGLINEHVSN
jgi:steroid 5-alpha reductase family enzyme